MRVRKIKSITQVELSALSGVNNVTISHYENGVRIPTVANAIKLAVALKVSLDLLFS
jgi:transcriptional regulator with XRE-family HTH domain